MGSSTFYRSTGGEAAAVGCAPICFLFAKELRNVEVDGFGLAFWRAALKPVVALAVYGLERLVDSLTARVNIADPLIFRSDTIFLALGVLDKHRPFHRTAIAAFKDDLFDLDRRWRLCACRGIRISSSIRIQGKHQYRHQRHACDLAIHSILLVFCSTTTRISRCDLLSNDLYCPRVAAAASVGSHSVCFMSVILQFDSILSIGEP